MRFLTEEVNADVSEESNCARWFLHPTNNKSLPFQKTTHVNLYFFHAVRHNKVKVQSSMFSNWSMM